MRTNCKPIGSKRPRQHREKEITVYLKLIVCMSGFRVVNGGAKGRVSEQNDTEKKQSAADEEEHTHTQIQNTRKKNNIYYVVDTV